MTKTYRYWQHLSLSKTQQFTLTHQDEIYTQLKIINSCKGLHEDGRWEISIKPAKLRAFGPVDVKSCTYIFSKYFFNVSREKKCPNTIMEYHQLYIWNRLIILRNIEFWHRHFCLPFLVIIYMFQPIWHRRSRSKSVPFILLDVFLLWCPTDRLVLIPCLLKLQTFVMTLEIIMSWIRSFAF